MKVNKLLLPVLALIVFFGGIGVAQATGNWIVSGRQMFDGGVLSTGADVRGWMSLQQVADGSGMDIADLYSRLALPDSITPETALKDLEGVVPGFEVTVVREVVDAYLGIAPAEPDLPLPESAAPEVATATPGPTATATPDAPLSTETPILETPDHTPRGDGTGEDLGAGPTPLPPGEVLPASEIKGRHTLQEIVDQAQVPADLLLEALGLPDTIDMHTALKDLAADGTIEEVDAVRAIVEELQQR